MKINSVYTVKAMTRQLDFIVFKNLNCLFNAVKFEHVRARCPTKKSVRSSLLYGLNMTRLSTELRNIKQRFAVLKVSNINNHDGSNLVCIGKSNTWVNLVVGFLACFLTARSSKAALGIALWFVRDFFSNSLNF